MDEWGSTESYATRVSRLTNQGSLLDSNHVFDDMVANWLIGASGEDLFIIGALDTITDLGASEVSRKAKKN